MNTFDVLSRLVDQSLSEVHTSIPGRIIKVNPDNTVDVEPTITYKEKPLPVFPGCPVLFPQTNGGGVSWKLTPGEFVLVLISEYSIDEWVAGTGQNVQTPSVDRFELSDAVALPGLFTLSNQPKIASDEGFVARYQETKITIKTNGDIELGGATASKMIKESFIDLFNSHTHPILGAATDTPLLPILKETVTTKTKAV